MACIKVLLLLEMDANENRMAFNKQQSWTPLVKFNGCVSQTNKLFVPPCMVWERQSSGKQAWPVCLFQNTSSAQIC